MGCNPKFNSAFGRPVRAGGFLGQPFGMATSNGFHGSLLADRQNPGCQKYFNFFRRLIPLATSPPLSAGAEIFFQSPTNDIPRAAEFLEKPRAQKSPPS